MEPAEPAHELFVKLGLHKKLAELKSTPQAENVTTYLYDFFGKTSLLDTGDFPSSHVLPLVMNPALSAEEKFRPFDKARLAEAFTLQPGPVAEVSQLSELTPSDMCLAVLA